LPSRWRQRRPPYQNEIFKELEMPMSLAADEEGMIELFSFEDNSFNEAGL